MKNGQSTHSMTTKKLRRKLSGYGLRGQFLKQRVRDIIAGPQSGSGGDREFAFGWSRDQMDRHMRRALIGKGYRVKFQVDNAERVIDKQAALLPARRRSVISISRRYLG
ncbi:MULTISPECIES: hypothetical protein [Enterobacterales]|uniref:Uncharacterized protein n=5 Tax=Enterobacterales TaxID=91347 RepID=A0A899NNI6_PROST|nr:MULTISPECIES: hypothetical protein [Enterobacterales]URQ57413.1 Hypothetical protein [Providencia alcalifaciens]HEK1035999.1 hypothetical protein [Proteus mirabilis]EKH6496509.1 hypothetical protein [Providencia rettgeri]ELQ1458034.1 hypothetical protein [Providencia rettgeri]ELR5042738.1 hypothetical protein [Providencia rettgeri]